MSAKIMAEYIQIQTDLQEFYAERDKILMSDVERISGKTNASGLVQRMKRKGIDLPPIYDSHEETHKRQAAALWAAYEDNPLTLSKAAKALNKKRNEHARKVILTLRDNGVKIPDVIMPKPKKKQKRTTKLALNDARLEHTNRTPEPPRVFDLPYVRSYPYKPGYTAFVLK